MKAVRDAVAGTDNDAIKRAHDDLAASIQKIGEAVYAQSPAGAGEPGDGSAGNGESKPGEGSGAGDDVVDAEFKEV